MEKIKELVVSLFPEAMIGEKDLLTITTKPGELHRLVETLYKYEETPFDYLKYLIGTDEGEMLTVIVTGKQIGRAHV